MRLITGFRCFGFASTSLAATNACFDQLFDGPDTVAVRGGMPCNWLEIGRDHFVHSLTVCAPECCASY